MTKDGIAPAAVKDVTPSISVGSARYCWVFDESIGVPAGAPYHIALTPPHLSERVVTFCGLAFPVGEIRQSITADRACAICLREYSPRRARK
jgi:hypothetical protein